MVSMKRELLSDEGWYHKALQMIEEEQQLFAQLNRVLTLLGEHIGERAERRLRLDLQQERNAVALARWRRMAKERA